MRILIVTDQFPPRHFGGMAQHAWHMASFLGKHHEVRVVGMRADRARVANAEENFSFRPILTKRWPQWDFHLIAREARKFGADVVHVCTAGLLDERLAGEIPVVTRVVGNDFLRPWCGYNLPLRSLHYRVPHRGYRAAIQRRELERRLSRVKNALRASDVVVVNSDWTRKHLLEARVLEERIETIVGGMDLGVFHPPADKDALRASLGLAADEKVLVTAGNLIRNKNFDTVIQAMAELVKEGHRNLQYFVVGDGDHQDRLEHLVSSLKLSDRVVFTGRVSQSDLSKYYQAADLYVQVSVEESMGRTYFEAGGCGIPVIGARVGGVPSVIEDGKNGVLVNEPDNVSEVAAKIRQLLLNPRDRRRMGEEGVRLARDKFSWKRVVSQFEAAMKIQ